MQKTNQKDFRVEQVIKKKKAINYMLNGKDTIVTFMIVGLIKKNNVNE